MAAVVRHLPADSALSREVNGADRAAWTLDRELLAEAVDSLHLLVWTKTKNAQRNRGRPKPIPRPSNNFNKRRMADVVTAPVDDVKRLLALPRREINRS